MKKTETIRNGLYRPSTSSTNRINTLSYLKHYIVKSHHYEGSLDKLENKLKNKKIIGLENQSNEKSQNSKTNTHIIFPRAKTASTQGIRIYSSKEDKYKSHIQPSKEINNIFIKYTRNYNFRESNKHKITHLTRGVTHKKIRIKDSLPDFKTKKVIKLINSKSTNNIIYFETPKDIIADYIFFKNRQKPYYIIKDFKIIDILNIKKELKDFLSTNKLFPQIIFCTKKIKKYDFNMNKESFYYFWQSSQYITSEQYLLALEEIKLGLKYDKNNFELLFNMPVIQIALNNFQKAEEVQ